MNFHHTCKLPIFGSNENCILNSEWLDTEIKVLILQGNQAWSGNFQLSENDDFLELLDQLSLSKEMYIKETKNALTTHGGAENFGYTIENDTFTWKKCMKKNFAIKFGSFNLLKVPISDVFHEIINKTLQENMYYIEKFQEADEERKTLRKENNILESKLNDLIVKKNEMETELYSKFLSLLNTKKEKISELKMKISTFEGNKDYSNEENSEGIMSNEEKNHFDSDTEIDSEVEEKLPKLNTTIHKQKPDSNDCPITTKRSRQKTSNDNLNKMSKTKSICAKERPKTLSKKTKQKIQRKFARESCVMEINEGKSNSEDAFMFPKRSEKTINKSKLIKPSTSRIKYDSDEETNIDLDKETNINEMKELDLDSDRTPSQINLFKNVVETVNNNKEREVNVDNKNIKQEYWSVDNEGYIDSKNTQIEECFNSFENFNEVININKEKEDNTDKSLKQNHCSDNNQEIIGGSKTINEKQYTHVASNSVKGLSSSALDILNKLI